MIQNVNNKKADKQLTLTDIKRICFAGCLNLFHTNSMFQPWSLGIVPMVYFHYVKRISKNEYQVQLFYVNPGYSTVSVDTIEGNDLTSDALWVWSLSDIISRHPNLECQNDGDERLLINAWYSNGHEANITNSKLGLFILKPTWGGYGYQTDNKGSFSYLLVITPKPGLFPVKITP